MPGVKRILLSSGIRFDASDNFEDEDCFMAIFNPSNLDLPNLEYLDVAGCTKLNSRGIQDLFTHIRGHDIWHLDISGCSTLVDDSIAAPVAALCHNLECLSLAGSKFTTYGAGIIAYCCRSTLRSLSL